MSTSITANYTFGTHAGQTYDAETLKSQFRRPSRAATTVAVLGAFVTSAPQFVDQGTSSFRAPASNPQGSLVQVHEVGPQDPTQIGAIFTAPSRTPPLTSGVLGRFQYVAEQPQDRPTIQILRAQVAGARPTLGVFQVSSPQIEDRPTVAVYPSVRTPIASPVGVFQWTPEQFQERPTQQIRPAQIAGAKPRTGVFQWSPPQHFDFTLPAQKFQSAAVPPPIFGPTVRSYVHYLQPDLNINYSVRFTPSTFSPSAPLTPGNIVVPSFIGLHWYAASEAVDAAGMTQNQPPIQQKTSLPVPPGTVIGQSIPVGTAVASQTNIVLTVTPAYLGGLTFGIIPWWV